MYKHIIKRTNDRDIAFSNLCQYIIFYLEMKKAKLPSPEYHDNALMLNAMLYNGVDSGVDNVCNLPVNEQKVLSIIRANTQHENKLRNLTLEPNFTKDIRKIGCWGTGDLQVIIKNASDFEKAKALISRAYNEN